MMIETLTNTLTENDKHVLVIQLGDRLDVTVKKLAYLLKNHYKNDKNYIGYQIKGEQKWQETELKKLRKLLNWNEVPIRMEN